MKQNRFEGCAFVFTPPGLRPVESPYSLRFDNFAGVDMLGYLNDMRDTFLPGSNVVPFNSFWRQERRKARG
jgi:hypothetical protein